MNWGWMIKLFDALHYIHQHGVLHRDIKPANILFRDMNTPVVVDFGIASKVDYDENLTADGVVVGTPAYMSPEQAIGNGATSQSDLYSMGLVYYEMLTGKNPFKSSNAHKTMYSLVHNPVPKLPPEYMHMQEIMDALLAKNPKDRFTNGEEVSMVLRHTLE